jgi:hypothetical protein
MFTAMCIYDSFIWDGFLPDSLIITSMMTILDSISLQFCNEVMLLARRHKMINKALEEAIDDSKLSETEMLECGSILLGRIEMLKNCKKEQLLKKMSEITDALDLLMSCKNYLKRIYSLPVSQILLIVDY